MNRLKGNTTISLNINRSVQNLSILIENQGRINYGDFIEDRKVIIADNKLFYLWQSLNQILLYLIKLLTVYLTM